MKMTCRDKSGDQPISEIFDRVFWSGDLNYRINGNRKIIDVLLERKMHDVLIFNDQLSIERNEGNVFQVSLTCCRSCFSFIHSILNNMIAFSRRTGSF